MIRLLLVLTLVGVFMLGGCTLTETSKASCQRIMAAQDVQMRMLSEDTQYVFLLDRPSFLTPWAVRSGLPN